MDEKLLSFAVQVDGPARDATLQGRPHRVFPVVLVREQVLHNNLGRTFLPGEEIEASVEAWNDIPIVIRHPSKRGVPVSARSPGILNARGAGRIFGARFDSGALKGEAWIDMTLAAAMAETGDVVNRVESGEIGEVSTGFATQIDASPGMFGNEPYDMILRALQPDHLALLPDEIGACSVVDGCGLGVNHSGDCKTENALPDPPCSDVAIEDPSWRKFLMAAAEKLGFVRNTEPEADAPTPEPGANDAGDTNPEEGSTMNREQMIAHLAGAGTDRAALEKLSDVQLTALCSAGEPAPEGDTVAWQKAKEWREKYVALESETKHARQSEERERADLLDDVLFNASGSPWSENEIRDMDIVELRKVHKVLCRRTSYTGRGGPRTTAAGDFGFVRSVMSGHDGESVLDRKEVN